MSGQSYQEGRHPNPYHLTLEHVKSAGRQKRSQSNRRHMEWTDREKVARGVEWGEKRDPESTIGHPVEDPVRRGGEKEHQGDSPEAKLLTKQLGGQRQKADGQQASKEERVGQTTMTPKVTVGNPHFEAEDIRIRENGTEDEEAPHAPRDPGSWNPGPQRPRGNRMRDQ